MSLSMKDLVVDEVSVEAALQPTSEVAKTYMHPIEDDTWVRQTQLVDLSRFDAVAEHGGRAKGVLLQTHSSEHSQSDKTGTSSPLQSALQQDEFMAQYKSSQLRDDANKANSYKAAMMANFRKKQKSGYA